MTRRVFLAGAAGAIGRRLIPLLVREGFHVIGTTRSPSKIEVLRGMGAEPVIVDVFDRTALAHAVRAARPDVVVHQLTDLPPNLNPDQMADAVRRNARLRAEGTRNLVDAARAVAVPRLVAQSIAWAYAPGPEPHSEEDPLDVDAAGDRGVTVGGVAALEQAVLGSPPLEGIVLRFGRLYGPGTGAGAAPATMPLHVDSAAFAAVLAVTGGAPGPYNIAEPNPQVATGKAEVGLGWTAASQRK